jgi:hypothetical protein
MDLSLRTENFASDDQSWLGSAHGTDAARTITLDTSAFTAGTHYPDGYFKSGIPLGLITTTGKYGPYNDAGADGTEVLAGFLFCAVDIPSVTTTDIGAAMLVHGVVIESKLPVVVNAAGKADVAGRIIFA